MAKEKQVAQAARPAEREVGFDFTAGELRTEEIRVPGHKAFTATFRVPGVAGRADLALASAATEAASRGEEMVRFVARHLVAWSLPIPAEFKSVAAIQSAAVLFGLFSAMRDAEEQRKN